MTNTAAIRPNGRQDIAALGAFLVLSALAGGLGSVATTPNIPTWYAGLAKPWFNPPNLAFPIVWTLLYVMIAVAGWLAWREHRPRALVPFFVQIALNVAWSFAFFGMHSPAAGLVVIGALWLSIVWTMMLFWPLSRAASLLLAPYLAWVSFAALLNAAILWLN
ncbi:MAG TPA: TspO/MBR family protein [Bauldia sp.]|nr:TspO/MBR family protein [Bauldia sp.]